MTKHTHTESALSFSFTVRYDFSTRYKVILKYIQWYFYGIVRM